MGHINLSPANEARQREILVKSIKDDDDVIPDHFWKVVFNHYEKDIEETGNDNRFAYWHPWVVHEYKIAEKTCEYIPVVYIPQNRNVRSEAAAEPSSIITIGIAVLIGLVIWIHKKRYENHYFKR